MGIIFIKVILCKWVHQCHLYWCSASRGVTSSHYHRENSPVTHKTTTQRWKSSRQAWHQFTFSLNLYHDSTSNSKKLRHAWIQYKMDWFVISSLRIFGSVLTFYSASSQGLSAERSLKRDVECRLKWSYWNTQVFKIKILCLKYMMITSVQFHIELTMRRSLPFLSLVLISYAVQMDRFSTCCLILSNFAAMKLT